MYLKVKTATTLSPKEDVCAPPEHLVCTSSLISGKTGRAFYSSLYSPSCRRLIPGEVYPSVRIPIYPFNSLLRWGIGLLPEQRIHLRFSRPFRRLSVIRSPHRCDLRLSGQ